MGVRIRCTEIRFHREPGCDELEVWVNVTKTDGKEVYRYANCIGHIIPTKTRDGGTTWRVRLSGLNRAMVFRDEITARRYTLHKFNEVVNGRERKEEEQEEEVD